MEIRAIGSLDEFKSKLKAHMWSRLHDDLNDNTYISSSSDSQLIQGFTVTIAGSGRYKVQYIVYSFYSTHVHAGMCMYACLCVYMCMCMYMFACLYICLYYTRLFARFNMYISDIY